MNEKYLTFTEYCTQLYRSKMDESLLLTQYIEKTGSQLKVFNEHYAYGIWSILNGEFNANFDQSAYQLTINRFNRRPFYKLEILTQFHTAFKNYHQLTETLQEFLKVNMDAQKKNKFYRLPLYVQLMDDCLTPLFRALTSISGLVADDDLKTLCNFLEKNDFESLTSMVDLSILEAIHAGDFISFSEGALLGFNLTIDNQVLLKTFTCAEFDEMIHRIYNLCSLILLGFSHVLSENSIQLSTDEVNAYPKLAFDSLALRLSLPNLKCLALSHIANKETQLNITMATNESDANFLICTAIEIMTQVFEIYPDYNHYFIGFESSKLENAFVRINKEEFSLLLEDYTKLSHYIEKMITRGDIQISEKSMKLNDLSDYQMLKNGGLPSELHKKTVGSDTDVKLNSHKLPKVGRNDLCPCGSKKKYKKCCGK